MEDSFLQLKHVREELGLTLNDVAQKLSIQRKYLENIEAGRWSELPENVYAIGFIRNYARFLKVKSDDIVEQFKKSRNIILNNDKEIDNSSNNVKFVFDKQIRHWFTLVKDDKKMQSWIIAGMALLVAVVSMLLM